MTLVGDRMQVVNIFKEPRRLESSEEKHSRKKTAETTNETQRKRKCQKAVSKNVEREGKRD